MKASDTVILAECHCQKYYSHCRCLCNDCKLTKAANEARITQAEISFKAGIKEGVDDLALEMENAKVGYLLGAVERCLEKWQSKLKEWGL